MSNKPETKQEVKVEAPAVKPIPAAPKLTM